MPRVNRNIDVDNLIERYLAGEPQMKLMTEFHVGHARFKSILASRGVRSFTTGEKLQKVKGEELDELIRRYQAGETMQQLADAYGVSSRIITDYLRRAGVQARSRHHGVQAWWRNATDEERAEVSAKMSDNLRKRWANATEDERLSMLEPAWEASRGTPRPDSVILNIVATKSAGGKSDSIYEEQLAKLLRERGVVFRQQVAVGKFCADFAVGNTLVEVCTDWARKKEWKGRFTHFLDAGWDVYILWHGTQRAIDAAAADDLVAWTKILEKDPTLVRQHRVFRSPGKIVSCGSRDGEYIAGIFRTATPRGHWPVYTSSGDEAQGA